MTSPSNSGSLYFRGLNALRCYAAFSVIIHHIELNFAELRTSAALVPPLDPFLMDAQTAVTLFFVLSGFLITSLLLTERTRTGTIQLRNFYLRRALRIAPLYYLICLIGFFVLPPLLGTEYALYDFPPEKTLLVLALLPTLVNPLGPLGHLWTIGLEEQFYVGMPWFVKRRRLIMVCVVTILVKLALAPIVELFNDPGSTNLFYGSRFESMAVGALGAWLVHHRHAALRLIYHPLAQAAAAILFVYVALVDIPVNSITTLILSVGFGVMIVNVATNPRSPLCVETRLTNYFGARSYGLYMYHYPLLYLTLWGLRALHVPDGTTYDVLLYAVTLGATLIAADLSYRYFERPLLNLKARFAVVASHATAPETVSSSAFVIDGEVITRDSTA